MHEIIIVKTNYQFNYILICRSRACFQMPGSYFVQKTSELISIYYLHYNFHFTNFEMKRY